MTTIAPFSLPGFPQLLNSLVASEIRRVNHAIQLCTWDDSCRQLATVSSLETEQPYCLPHFREVERGY